MTTEPTPAPAPQSRPVGRATVAAREQVSPHLVRLVVHSPAMAAGELVPNTEFTDSYIKIELTDADGDVVLRTYTIREWRPETAEFVLDFVVHGDEGLAGPWARDVAIGTEFTFRGPGGAFAPDTETAGLAHLFVGDLSALPAIEVALTAVPADHPGQVVIAHDNADDVRDLGTHLPVEWIIAPDLAAAHARAVEFVQAWQQPGDGDLEVFLHGEAGFVRQLRRHARVDRGVPKQRQSISGYWKYGRVDEQWRDEKKVWAQPVDEAEAALAG